MCRSDPTRILWKDLLFQFTFSPNHKVIRMWIKYTYISIPAGRGGSNPSLLCSAWLISLSHSPGKAIQQSDLIIRGWDATGFATSQCASPVIYISSDAQFRRHKKPRPASLSEQIFRICPCRMGSFSVSYSSKSELDDRALQILFC